MTSQSREGSTCLGLPRGDGAQPAFTSICMMIMKRPCSVELILRKERGLIPNIYFVIRDKHLKTEKKYKVNIGERDSPRSGALEADGAMLRGVATESRKKSHRHFGMAAVAK